MSSPRPGPQHTPESGARLLVNLLRNRVAVVSSPAQYLGTERMDDPVLGDVHVVLQPGLHTTEVFDHLLILRFGEKFAIRISPDVETQEVETLVQVDDCRLVRIEGKPSFREKGLDLGQDVGVQRLPRGTTQSSANLTSVMPVFGAAFFGRTSGLCPATAFSWPVEQPFEPVQCNVGEQGGHHSPNAKDNFAFDRGIRLDRGACVLDLRRKG